MSGYFFSSVLPCSPSFTALLKFLIPSPSPLPKSASLPGPKIRSAMPSSSNSSGIPSLPPNIKPPKNAVSVDDRTFISPRQKLGHSERSDQASEESYPGSDVVNENRFVDGMSPFADRPQPI